MKMPLILERMMFGFIESQILFVCDELHLFDRLIAEGPSSLEQLSKLLQLPMTSLERLLIGACCMHLLEKHDNHYMINSEWVPFLSRKSAHYCGGKFSHYFKTSYQLFNHLLPAVHENKPQWEKIGEKELSTNNLNANNLNAVYTDYIYSSNQSTLEFLSTMWASGYMDSLDLCNKFSFASYKKLVDLGGATGSFAIAAIQKNPSLQAVIMDFPQVKSHAEEKIKSYALESRARFHTGDVFNDALPHGDIYVIGYLLSDWPESIGLALIQKAYDELPMNGLIVILEKLFNEEKTGPYLTAMLNLTMLLEMHGSHRSTSDYFKWLKNAGFKELQVVFSSGEKHMIIGKKN